MGLVNPSLVEKLGVRFTLLKVLVAFCQLDGSLASGIPVIFITQLIEMWTETLSFIVAPGMKRFGAETSMATEQERVAKYHMD